MTGTGGSPESFTFRCDPSPCDATTLDGLKALVAQIQAGDRACAQVYGGPEQLHVTGQLDGKSVDVRIKRTDGCGMEDYDRFFELVARPAPLAPESG